MPIELKKGEDAQAYYERVFQSHMHGDWDNAPGKKVVLAALMRFRDQLSNELVICDIGCGNGFLLNKARVLFPNAKCVGIDFSPTAIELARATFADIDFQCEDGSRTSLADGSCDVVISYGSYEHFPESSTAIQELSRVLKAGGLFFIMIPTLEAYWDNKNNSRGWYPDKTGQPQWNLPRSEWASHFAHSKLELFADNVAESSGALKPDVFFFGRHL